MSALAINTCSDYAYLGTQTKTSPIKRNLQSGNEQEFISKYYIDALCKKSSFLHSYNNETESLNDTNSNGICVTYINRRLQPIILNHNGIYALGIKKELDALIERQNETDDILLFLFDKLEDNLIEQKYDICNFFFRLVNTEDYNDIILIGILTATLPWKKHLSGRQLFFQYVKNKIDNAYSEEEVIQLLCGLE